MNSKILSALITGDAGLLRALWLDQDQSRHHGKTVKGNSVLHIAASHGNIWAVTQICKHPDTDLLLHQNARGDTALHCAARAGQAHIIEFLIRHAVGQNAGKLLTCLLNAHGEAALHDAARAGLADAVRKLVVAAPEMAAVVNKDGESPLYLAAEGGRWKPCRS